MTGAWLHVASMTFEPARSICLVDDDDFVRESLCALLEAHAFKVEAFASGGDFLAQPNGHADSCLLLDIHMPEMSGLDTLKKLRARKSAMPVILITGRRDHVIEAQAKELGAIALLDKPVPATSLLAAIHRALPTT